MPSVLAPPSPVDLTDPETLSRVQQQFTAALPKINRVLRFRLRGLPEEVKDDLVAEATALSWQGYLSLVRRGKDPEPLINKIAQFAARHAYRGGRLAGKEPVRDVMSRGTGRHVRSIEAREDGRMCPDVLDGMSAGATSPADQAAFNLDFAEWLESQGERDQAVVGELSSGSNTVDVARRRNVTRGAVSNWRREMRKDFEEFMGEDMGR